MEGLSEEIALLRVLLDERLTEGATIEEIAKGVELLIRAVSAQYRMSDKSKQSLTDALAEVLERLGTQMGLQEPP